VRPELILEPGAAQLAALGLVSVSTVALMFSLQATFSDRSGPNAAIRLALAGVAMFILFIPSELLAAAACIPAALIIGHWIMNRRHATPELAPASES
jgi:hypothetical protein